VATQQIHQTIEELLLQAASENYLRLCSTNDFHAFSKITVLSPFQSGFRTNFRTSDNIFVLKTLVDKQISTPGGKLYACFVDFKKAFDSVWRNGLFYKILSSGVGGNFFKIIQTMYSNIEYCVKNSNGLSAYFKSTCGVRQGCNLSPLLFNLYVNDLPTLLNSPLCDPVILKDTSINSLFWADDLVLLSKSESGLKECLKRLDNFCSTWKLTINKNKTKIMIFSKNGQTSKNYRPHFQSQGHTLDITSSYTYLGVDITPSGSFNRANKQLRTKALRASFKLKSLLSTNHNPSTPLALELFNSLVKPILLYCSEILSTNIQCRDLILNGIKESPNENIRYIVSNILSPIVGSPVGIIKTNRIGKKTDPNCSRPILIRLKKYSDKLKIVHNSNILRNQNVSVEQPTVSYEVPDLEYVLLNYYKILLRVPRSSVNAAVRGELGAFPLYIDTQTQLIKYWLRLQNMPNDRIVKKAYDVAVEEDQDWAVHVQDMLSRHGFRNIWLNPTVDAKYFGNTFKERMKDAFLSEWRQKIRNNNKLKVYSKIKTQFGIENYLLSIQNKNFVNSITKLRISAHCLEIEKGRHHKIPTDQRLCPSCQDDTSIEDEYHFIMTCPTYNEERQKLMKSITCKSNISLPHTSDDTFNVLLSCHDSISMYIGQYIYHAMQKRNCTIP